MKFSVYPHFCRNVLECGLSQALTLGDSDKYDCALCGCVADVDLDGSNEVIIGTYGQVRHNFLIINLLFPLCNYLEIMGL